MTNVWCVRAENGKHTQAFVDGGYVGGGWFSEYGNAASVTDKEELKHWFEKSRSEITSPYVTGAIVGMAFLFLREIQIDDYVITPAEDSSQLWYGQVTDDLYYEPEPADGCWFPHRRKVDWAEKPLNKSEMSVSFQQTMKAAKSAFAIPQRDEFWVAISRTGPTPTPPPKQDHRRVVLDHILKLDPDEFEIFVSHLLSALGVGDTEVVGKPGDEGVDVKGVLNVSNLAVVEIYVQAKRYKNKTVSASAVKKLRQVIPQGGQGAVVTTADFGKGAREAATESGFPRIGLINGSQLSDLLIEYWNDIPDDFQEMLGLKFELVPIQVKPPH